MAEVFTLVRQPAKVVNDLAQITARHVKTPVWHDEALARHEAAVTENERWHAKSRSSWTTELAIPPSVGPSTKPGYRSTKPGTLGSLRK
jgi:hypothetical protein